MLDEQVKTSGGQGAGGSTVTVKLQLVATAPQSKAVQVTVVVPIGKQVPLGGLQMTVTGAQVPPVAVLLKDTTAQLVQGPAVTTMFVEQLSVTRLLVGARKAIVPGAVTEGDQVAPPSRLTSVKMSKKLPMR